MRPRILPADRGLSARWRFGVVLLGLATGATAAEPDWPAWRGPQANGSTPRKAPERWTTNDIAWKVPLPGKGSSTPIAWRDTLYVTAPAGGQDAVLAFDLAGRQLWMTRLGPESSPKHKTLGSSCNASPVTDGRGLFVYFRSGRLVALEPDGTVRWQVDLTERFGPEKLFWDQGSSPVVTEQLVILTRLHGGESWVAGFDKSTGALRWREPRNYKTPVENDNGYTTPVLIDHHGTPALLVWGAEHLTAHEVASGKLLWSCGGFNPQGTGYWPAIASPVVQDHLVIVPVGRDDRPGQARVHGVRLGGTGDVSNTHRAWTREDLGVFVSTPAASAGRVYLLRHRGEVVCLDPKTGSTLWAAAFPRERAPYYSSPLVANGVLYAAREDGVVFTARVGERFELLGEHPLGERIVASPVPVAGRLLLRGDAHLFCIQAR